MANGVDVQIGTTARWNTSTFSVTEDATPIDPSSSAGGYGAFTLTTDYLEGDKKLIGQPIAISDGAQGVNSGFITTLSGDYGVLNITAAGQMSLMNATVNAAPFHGTLGNAFAYYLGLVGITSEFETTTDIASAPVVFPGFTAVLWDKLKDLCSGQGVEIGYVSDVIVLRAIRSNTAQRYRDENISWTLDDTSIAQEVQCFYYNPVWISSGLAYPQGGLAVRTDIQPIQVNAGEMQVTQISLEPTGSDGTGIGCSLVTLNAPTCGNSIAYNYAGGSTYSIIDQNNNPYPSTKWNALGGQVTAVLNPDSSSITLTVIGPNDPDLQPFRLGAYADVAQTDLYSTLRLTGTGNFYNKKLLTIPTGNTLADTATVSSQVIDNFAINDIGDANSAALNAMGSAAGPTQSIQVTTSGINTLGDPQAFTLLTFAEFDDEYGAKTFSAGIDADIGGLTFTNADAVLSGLISNKFANQAFGNIGGARVLDDNCYYRISTATVTQSSVQYTALADTTLGDWDSVFAGKTFANWDAIWSGMTFVEYSPTPLSTVG